jgi:predicted Fe-Mo cluster-binding NifX family protein
VRVAVALFNDEVSPWCDFARSLLLATVEAGRVLETQVLPLEDAGMPARIAYLAGLGVTVVLCGGFSREFLPDAERAGIRVIWGQTGPARAALEAFAAGRLDERPGPTQRARRARGA